MSARGQNTLVLTIQDEATKMPLSSATVAQTGTGMSFSSSPNGVVNITNIPDGRQQFIITHVGYEPKEVVFSFPASNGRQVLVLLSAEEAELEEVIVESTRMNRSIRRIPTRIETLTEEIDEAASMEPSRIAHLITHSTGIQVQTTAASSNGAVVRIQGLPGRYTKILKDGFPMYGGFSGSLDILQIPPLDLRQVEYIKGSASTLYGGGAIAGILNLLSKRAQKDEVLLHINRSSIGSNDLNAFVSRKFGKWGFTNLASYQLHAPYDADKDGYTDLPQVYKFNFNPKLFFTPSEKTQLYLGAVVSREQRKGGDLLLVKRYEPTGNHFYLDHQESTRATTQFRAEVHTGAHSRISVRNSVSFFDRYVNIRENAANNTTIFGGRQTASFSEIAWNKSFARHELVLGGSYVTDVFREKNFAGNNYPARDESHFTAGAFANHIWDAAQFFSVESGLRTEWNKNKSAFTTDGGAVYLLPRINALFKYGPKLTTRIGGGMGYRPLTVFNEEAEPFGYKGILPVNFAAAKAERSFGLNADINYQAHFAYKALLTINHMFFFNQIRNPVVLRATPSGREFTNSSSNIQSKGFETQVKYTIGKFTLFVGYTYTDAVFDFPSKQEFLALVPKHSIKGDILFVEEEKWRIGWDYEFKSRQRLSNDQYTRNLFMTGVIVERTLGNFVLFFNAENITDVRQSRYESLLSQPYNTPQFTEAWAPLDGRFFNFGLKVVL